MNNNYQPEEGDHVRILFNNGLKDEGIVLQWTEEISALQSLNQKSILIIQHTNKDIMAVEIIFKNDVINNKVVDLPETHNFNDEEETIILFENLPPEEGFEYKTRAKKLAALHLEKAKIDREEVKKKIFSLDTSENTQVQYGIPTMFSPPKRTRT